MAARLAQILAAIQTAMGPVATFKTGGKHVAAQDAPPRIVWVPTRDAAGPARQQDAFQRAVMTRRASLVAHVWGTDLEAAENLVHALLAATHAVALGAYEYGGTDWMSPEHTDRGEVALVTLTFDLPVLEAEAVTALIEHTAVDSSGAVSGDGTLTAGETP